MDAELDDSGRGKGAVYVNLKAYLERLEAEERSRLPGRRQDVPTLRDLAVAIGVHPVTLSNIANNRIKQVNLAIAAAIITEMRRRGFPMEISDLLAYRPPEP